VSADQTTQDTLIAALLDLHKPWYEINGVRIDHTVVFGNDVPEGHVCRVGTRFDSCEPAIEEHYVLACVECRGTTEDGEPGYSLWPCPTARLAAGAGDPSECLSCGKPSGPDLACDTCRPMMEADAAADRVRMSETDGHGAAGAGERHG
jgi:hypothetical protein